MAPLMTSYGLPQPSAVIGFCVPSPRCSSRVSWPCFRADGGTRGRLPLSWPSCSSPCDRHLSHAPTQPRSTGLLLPMSTIPHRAKLLAVIGSPCPYCGQTMQIPDRPPSRDHIKPRSKGYALFGNLSLVCCAATPTRALYRWANGLRACHELATLAPIMWRRSLSVV